MSPAPLIPNLSGSTDCRLTFSYLVAKMGMNGHQMGAGRKAQKFRALAVLQKTQF